MTIKVNASATLQVIPDGITAVFTLTDLNDSKTEACNKVLALQKELQEFLAKEVKQPCEAVSREYAIKQEYEYSYMEGRISKQLKKFVGFRAQQEVEVNVKYDSADVATILLFADSNKNVEVFVKATDLEAHAHKMEVQLMAYDNAVQSAVKIAKHALQTDLLNANSNIVPESIDYVDKPYSGFNDYNGIVDCLCQNEGDVDAFRDTVYSMAKNCTPHPISLTAEVTCVFRI